MSSESTATPTKGQRAEAQDADAADKKRLFKIAFENYQKLKEKGN
jgi:hypothetical protein